MADCLRGKLYKIPARAGMIL